MISCQRRILLAKGLNIHKEFGNDDQSVQLMNRRRIFARSKFIDRTTKAGRRRNVLPLVKQTKIESLQIACSIHLPLTVPGSGPLSPPCTRWQIIREYFSRAKSERRLCQFSRRRCHTIGSVCFHGNYDRRVFLIPPFTRNPAWVACTSAMSTRSRCSTHELFMGIGATVFFRRH